MNAESQSETKHSLTEGEIKIVLATARLHKIRKLEWMAKGNPLAKDVSDIELTEDEANAAILKAEKLKETKLFCEQVRADNRLRRQTEKAELVAKWDAAYFYRVMKDRAYVQGEDFIYNEGNERLVKAICFRLSSDPRYETELGFSFRKGLIIRGTPGLGKTFIPSLVADNPVCPIQILSMNEITETVRKTGEFLGIKFGTYELIYLDDLGTEETPVKFFGTEIHWFKAWYENFYATAKNKSYRLMVSTNLSFQEIEDKYGFRIRDRMAETFDVLDISGTSLRRK